MAKFVFFSPNKKMKEMANKVADKMGFRQFESMAIPDMDEMVECAKVAERNGADIIISRGLQATFIRENIEIPVVEVRLTGQEIASLITQAKEKAGGDGSIIAFIGSKNMFPNLSRYGEIFHVTIMTFELHRASEVEYLVDEAVEAGNRVIVGGQSVCDYSQKIGIPFLNLSGTEDSIREAFRVAEQVAYAADLEKKNKAELSTLLDYSVNGIIKIDCNGIITNLNLSAENLLHIKRNQILKKHINNLIPDVTNALLHQVLVEGQSIYSVMLTINGSEVISNFVPIKLNDEVESMILSFQVVKSIVSISSKVKQELHIRKLVANSSFSSIYAVSDEMKETIREAKILALTDAPILLYGEPGTEKDILAECIHNESYRKNGPFAAINSRSFSNEQQRKLLMGISIGQEIENELEQSPLLVSDNGTLFIKNIEYLTLNNQELLSDFLSTGCFYSEGYRKNLATDVRLIVSTKTNLHLAVKEGMFLPELYYQLSNSLFIPSLRSRKEDIASYADIYFKKFCSKYSRIVSLTQEAEDILFDYPWPGNLLQFLGFCERLVAITPRRKINGKFIKEQLELVYPSVHQTTYDSTQIISQDPNAVLLAELLEKHNGNRARVAEELGISRSTLWRKMKKYNIQNKYDL